MNKCEGCGIILQSIYPNELGYTKHLDAPLCERCFRIKNYHDYKLVNKTNNDYVPILNNINKTDSLVVLVIDLFNISKNIEIISKYLNNKILLVLTKRDILPKSIYDVNLLKYFDNYNLNIVDKIIISSKNNYNFDLLYNKINKYKTNNDVYVVGFTNAGKSTMINKLIYNYSDKASNITTSILPSTTLNTLKKITPSKEIKPVVYQIKVDQTIIIEDLFRIDIPANNNLTFYLANDLEYTRVYKQTDKLNNLHKHVLDIDSKNDIVINGLGFIKVSNKTSVTIYTLDNVDVFVRKSLI